MVVIYWGNIKHQLYFVMRRDYFFGYFIIAEMFKCKYIYNDAEKSFKASHLVVTIYGEQQEKRN